MRILRSKDYRRMRWKNGGGETTEIIVSPDGAALDAFDWRVSMAHVAMDGPFSLFPGIDRTLAVLDGNGIRLRVNGFGERDLTQTSEPFAFPADAASGADLIDGSIIDLNVMSRRGVVRHTLSRTILSEPIRIATSGEAIFVLVQGGGARIEASEIQDTLADGDSVLLSAGHEDVMMTPVTTLTLYEAVFQRTNT
ncbi:HutD family protein [Pseudolabrys sp. FHR47]|uniref:HutD/Ves family protein n=1 Tax=Pseudolabrys sp. FHR47 TaxID=2562284 RepID=UPI0010BEAB45|nr:HutD family protein [Pseudolabrys sp. FHR47]